MNYLAHAWPYLDQPYVVAGTALPDWLNAVDRRLRLRNRWVRQLAASQCDSLAAIARGVLYHWQDDAWFHRHPAFAELSSRFAWQIQKNFGDEPGVRPHFLGHITVELLLDSVLIEASPAGLERYYGVLESIDPGLVAEAARAMTGQRPERLAEWLRRFLDERFLKDYVDDEALARRLNQVLRRIGLDPVAGDLPGWLCEARQEVQCAAYQLLDGRLPKTV